MPLTNLPTKFSATVSSMLMMCEQFKIYSLRESGVWKESPYLIVSWPNCDLTAIRVLKNPSVNMLPERM